MNYDSQYLARIVDGRRKVYSQYTNCSFFFSCCLLLFIRSLDGRFMISNCFVRFSCRWLLYSNIIGYSQRGKHCYSQCYNFRLPSNSLCNWGWLQQIFKNLNLVPLLLTLTESFNYGSSSISRCLSSHLRCYLPLCCPLVNSDILFLWFFVHLLMLASYMKCYLPLCCPLVDSDRLFQLWLFAHPSMLSSKMKCCLPLFHALVVNLSDAFNNDFSSFTFCYPPT